MSRLTLFLALFLISLACVVSPAFAAEPDSAAQTAAVRAGERAMGATNAPVTILEFSSLTCPHCATFHTDTLAKLKEQYIDTGKVRLVFSDFPLDQIALAASKMTRCLNPMRFFPVTDMLFRNQAQWAHTSDPMKALAIYGRMAGLSQEEFDACMADKDLQTAILKNRMEAAQKHQVKSTPTFIFNDGAKRIEGAYPVEDFTKVIDGLLPR
ncbi:Disulfide bond formation protein DsbA [Azospirillaceae bacterium]